MARYSYDRLTALDNSFLVLETPNAYMHVGSTLIHEAGPFRRNDGGIDAEAIKSKTSEGLGVRRLQSFMQRRVSLGLNPEF